MSSYNKNIFDYNDDMNSNYRYLEEHSQRNSCLYKNILEPDEDLYKDKAFNFEDGYLNDNTGINTHAIINNSISLNICNFNRKDNIFANSINFGNPEEESINNNTNILHPPSNGPDIINNQVQNFINNNLLNRKRNNPNNIYENNLISETTNNNILHNRINNKIKNKNKEKIFHVEKVAKNNIYENNKNDEDIKNSNLPNCIKFSYSSIFNYNVFKKYYDNENNSSINIINSLYENEPPPFFSIEKIKIIPIIQQLWSGINSIFDNEKHFNNTVKNGIIYNYLFNYLNLIKNKNIKVSSRNHMPDEMSKKYKTFIIQEVINSINSFEEMKNNEIIRIDNDAIYEPIKADFQLALLRKKIYTLISNDVNSINKKCNYQIIEKIIKEYNEKKEHISLIKYLLLNFQDCLDIILYKKDDPNNKFTKKLIDFLNYNYKKLNTDDISTKKDYVAALLLLGYNFERLFYLKPIRAFRKNG